MSQLALQSQVEYTMTIVSGPDKGEIFKLMSTTISIGRASTNDIVLARDAKCSRQHAEINISSTGIIIKSLNPKNLINVDGKEGATLFLNHNSKIMIGSTKILFQISMLIKDGASAPPALFYSDSNENKGLGPTRPQQMPNKPITFHQPKKNNLRLILIVALFVIVIFALTEEDSSPLPKKGIRTDQDIENEIDTLNKLREAEIKLRKDKGVESDQYEEAHSHYIIGFRDFKKGKFERAISSFQACLTIFPKHDLCKTYRGLAQKRFQELIQYHMISGNKFADNGQYSACITSFKNVMYMVKDRSSKVYLEADSKRKYCETRLRGRF